jgi:hypothetical protein
MWVPTLITHRVYLCWHVIVFPFSLSCTKALMLDQLINPKHAVCAFYWEFKLCSIDMLLLLFHIWSTTQLDVFCSVKQSSWFAGSTDTGASGRVHCRPVTRVSEGPGLNRQPEGHSKMHFLDCMWHPHWLKL